MIDNTKNTTSTGEPVSNQAPAATAKETAPVISPATVIPASLPSGYLANGSMIDADGVMLPEYIGEYAQELAQRLKPLKASTFARSFLTKAREANKKKVPYSVKKNCTLGMVTAAKKLVKRTKDPAPRVLVDMIQAATATVVDDATFDVLYMHLDAICTNL